MSVETISQQHSFGGVQGFYRHASSAIGGTMKFGVFCPPLASGAKAPVLTFLAGLTCSEETFAIKAGAQRVAAELGLILVTPDTSPRDTGIEGATGDWEFGEGAGFYLDATTPAFAPRFAMYDYVTRELPALIGANFASADLAREGIFGHSMGGHGALTIALKNPGRYKSVSAFAPIAAPGEVPWGRKALSRYLGDDVETWKPYDACALIADGAQFPGTILVDQGTGDKFLETQLQPERFEHVCRAAGQSLSLHMRAGYDHSYYFISTFMEDHLRHHAQALNR